MPHFTDLKLPLRRMPFSFAGLLVFPAFLFTLPMAGIAQENLGNEAETVAAESPLETAAGAAKDGIEGENESSAAAEAEAEVEAEAEAEAEEKIAVAIEAGRYGEALSLLAELGPIVEGDVFLLRLKAFCLIEAGRYNEALGVTDRILSLDPGDSYASFYRAQALVGIGDGESAARQVKKVVREAPASAAANLVRAELPEIEQIVKLEDQLGDEIPLSEMRQAKKLVEGTLYFGAGYDTNASFVPRDSGRNPPGSFYLETSLGIDMNLVDEQRDGSPVSLTVAGDFYRSLYLRAPLDDFDYTLAEASLRVSKKTRLFGNLLEIGVTPGFRRAWLGSDDFYQNFSLAGSIDYYLTSSIQASLYYQWAPTKFLDNPEFPEFFDRDGDSHYASAALSSWILSNRVWIQGGYSLLYEEADGTQMEYRAQGGFATAFLFLPGEFKLGLSARYGRPNYLTYVNAPERSDRRLELTASLRRAIFIDGLEGVLRYYHVRSRSNQNFAAYNRNLITAGFEYRF